MIYLSIPKGMVFKQIEGKNGLEDFFIDPTDDTNTIELQQLVKNALRNAGRKTCIPLKEFSIYLRHPPLINENFLAYQPTNNGRYATTQPVRMVLGDSIKLYPNTRYGTLWFHTIPITAERMLEIEEKRYQQRHDRRHDGDSPKPT